MVNQCRFGAAGVQWVDLTGQLIDNDMMRATIENPVLITLDEIPEPTFKQVPFTPENPDVSSFLYYEKMYYPEKGFSPIKLSKRASSSGSPSEITITPDMLNLGIYARTGTSGDYDPINGSPQYEFINFSAYRNSGSYSAAQGYTLYYGGGSFGSLDNWWGYIGYDEQWAPAYNSSYFAPGTSYTFLAKFKTNRVDCTGKVISDFGFCIISSPEPLVPGKQYKCITTTEQCQALHQNREAWNDGWVNITYCVIDASRASGMNYNKVKRGYTALPSIYAVDSQLIWVLAIEGAIIANTIERGVGPLIGATDTGMVALYATPATSGDNKMKELAKALWNPEMVESIKQSLFNVDDAVLNLSLMPINLAAVQSPTGDPVLGAEESVVLNGVTVSSESGQVSMNKVNTEFVKIRWAPIKVDGPTHTYLDSSPYTSARLELPYSGSWNILIDDFIGGYMQMTMIIDLFNGNVLYEIYATPDEDTPTEQWKLLYRFTGNMMYTIPMTSGGFGETWTSFVTSLTPLMRG